jgi:hypothetical protein
MPKGILVYGIIVAGVNCLVSSSSPMKMSIIDRHASYPAIPARDSIDLKSRIVKLAAVVPLAAALVATPRKAAAKDAVVESTTSPTLGNDAYTELGNMKMCKILTGMWQVSGAHGYEPQKQSAVAEMGNCAGML